MLMSNILNNKNIQLIDFVDLCIHALLFFIISPSQFMLTSSAGRHMVAPGLRAGPRLFSPRDGDGRCPGASLLQGGRRGRDRCGQPGGRGHKLSNKCTLNTCTTRSGHRMVGGPTGPGPTPGR